MIMSNRLLYITLKDFVRTIGESPYRDLVILKGGLNLEVALYKYNSELSARPTVDADFQVTSKATWEKLLQDLPTLKSPNGFKYTVKERRGFDITPDSDSAVIETDKGVNFDVDVNISLYEVSIEIYDPEYPKGYSIESMLADKLWVFYSKKIYRRSKDVYDLYLLSKAKNYILAETKKVILEKWANTGMPESPLHFADLDRLKHAYSKLIGIEDKPPFEEIYKKVFGFTAPLIDFLYDKSETNLAWDRRKGEWIECG